MVKMNKLKDGIATSLRILIFILVNLSFFLKYLFYFCFIAAKLAYTILNYIWSFFGEIPLKHESQRNHSCNYDSDGYDSGYSDSYIYNQQRQAIKNNGIRKLHNPQYSSVTDDTKREICYLPNEFGSNAKLYAAINNQERGIKRIYSRHGSDFVATKTSSIDDEKLIFKSLEENLILSKFIGEEIHQRKIRFIWDSTDSRGNLKQLVTVMEPCKGKDDYELITAYKRPNISLKHIHL